MPENFFLYGPSGSGKSSLGKELAQNLKLDFHDLDAEIETRADKSIATIFADEGESGFRIREKQMLQEVVATRHGVIALGGGALLDPENKALVSREGVVLCLTAPLETLLERLHQEHDRPLLEGERREEMLRLLEERSDHYDSFPRRLDTGDLILEEAVREAQIVLGAFRIQGMGLGYDVRVKPGSLEDIGASLRERGLLGPIVVVSDKNVGRLYSGRVGASLRKTNYEEHGMLFPAGEVNKTIETVMQLWDGFARARMERKSTVIALGGGVVGDLAGFAAATFLRGVPWVNVPTSMLAMVDACVGGKTGANLPQGKNLIGAFHAPSLVLVDPETLSTLPGIELRNGLAEAVKTGLIGDPVLFKLCEEGWGAVLSNLEEIVCRALAVKIKIIEQDPYEAGLREVLNLGHTVGHAVEVVSDFKVHHGEAVAIGMVAEARLSQHLGLAEEGLVERLVSALQGINLPVEVPEGLDRNSLVAAMMMDKKRTGGNLRFSLPVRAGEVKTGVEIDATEVMELLG